MNDKVYFVFSDGYCGELVLTDKYFTDENNAKLFAEYCNLCEPLMEDYEVVALECGNNIDYAKMIEQLKAEKEAEAKEREREVRRADIRNYAYYKSKLEGGDIR